MKSFRCDACNNPVFFENTRCLQCGHALGFLPDVLDLSAIEIGGNGLRLALAREAEHRGYRECENQRAHAVCNWMVPEGDPNPFCAACRLNEVIPNLKFPGNWQRWKRVEAAKRRLLYTLFKLHLPIDELPEEGRPALRFAFLGDLPGEPPVITGHENGLVTLNIAEADDDVREQRRVQFNEPLRTLVGHFRHEAAHYYWFRILAGSSWLPRFRELFGDESADYQAALDEYHHRGPADDWSERCVSAYASAHPWEDWAETTAHYFHIVDAVETAIECGIAFNDAYDSTDLPSVRGSWKADSFGCDELLGTWLPLTRILNSFNRGMGLPDLYPFVINTRVVGKLRFVHEVLDAARKNGAPTVLGRDHDHVLARASHHA